MTHVSRPLVALLVGTVLFFALWIVALKPSGSGGAAASHGGLGQYQSAINAARKSVKLQDHQGSTDGTVPNPAATTATTAATHTATTAATHSAKPVHHAATRAKTATSSKAHRAVVTTHDRARTPAANHRFETVTEALQQHRVIAMLFYNPAGSDDRFVKSELGSVPTDGGRVVKLSVPIAELSRYTVITTQVMVSTTPTLVIIDRQRSATLITGYASAFEIQQRVAGALRVK